jgi:hypothetical protein
LVVGAIGAHIQLRGGNARRIAEMHLADLEGIVGFNGRGVHFPRDFGRVHRFGGYRVQLCGSLDNLTPSKLL